MRSSLVNLGIRLYKKEGNESERPYHRLKMMSFLFKGKKLITYGINSEKTDPIQNQFRIKARKNSQCFWLDKCHCEIDCLKDFYKRNDIDYSQYSILIISIRNDGTMRDSKPCKTCERFLNDLGIGEICYFKGGRFVSEKLFKNK